MRRSEFIKFRANARKIQDRLWDWHKIIVESTDTRAVFAGLGKESMISFEPAEGDRIRARLWRPDGAWVNQRLYSTWYGADSRLSQWVHDETEEDW